MQQKKYRVAVIGRTGKGGYGHGLDVVWKEIDNAEIVAVADPDEKGLAAAAKKLGVKNAYSDYRTMLQKEKPQIVSVADRHLDAHRDMVVACAKAGASVFLEKPMARTLAEADEMVKACETHHVKLAIAHQTRYSPRLERARELVTSGKLGDLLELRGRGKEDARRGGGEDIMVLGTHIFDLMRLLAGDAAWCFAKVMQGGKPVTKAQVRPGAEGMGWMAGDHINAVYGFEKGVMGTFGTHRSRHPGSRFGLSVYGTKGILQMETGSLPRVLFCEDPTWMPGKSKATWEEVTSAGLGKPEKLKGGGAGAGNVWIVKDLIESIEKDRQPKGSMYDGMKALEMVLAPYESHRLNAPVELPLKNREHPLTKL